ncbi:unnamed protein product [Paramecium pentaurelia]|uniref:Protein kinase domain containing protein n=1 Tax=Paramecium pentaurelia TaxID=43138 RepID=A0A8S1Y3F4_9CILI|nr:unnamed protein product [Paramecium pentaurelia]
MGACQMKSKQKTNEDQPQSSTTRKSDQVFTLNNPSLIIQTATPNLENINEPYEETKKQLRKIKENQCSYIRYYTRIPQGNQKLLNHQQLVQHNLTGKIRIVEVYERNSINEQFLTELESLDHPKIITVHEVFITEESFQLVLDYCSGGQLSDYFSDKSIVPFSESDIASIIYQCAEVLQYLQNIGRTHGHLTLNCFSRVDTSNDIQIKFTDIRGLYIKHQINNINIYTLAPEICNSTNEYPSSVDVWSLGILAYQMICGYPPFGGSTIQSVKQQIKKMAAQYNNFQFDRVSKSCVQLIKKILVPFKSRISLSTLMNDQWFKLRSIQNDSNIIKKLQQNKVKISPLQQLFLTFMIKNFCSADQQQLHAEFLLLDENQDGQLSKQELLKVYSNRFDTNSEAILFIDNIFKIADIDKSGTIDFGEFIVAITDKSGLLTEDNLKMAFKSLAASNGKLTRQALRYHFNLTLQKIDKLFADHNLDVNNVGYSEFEKLMKQML